MRLIHEAESTDAPARGGLLRRRDEGPVMGLERSEQAIAIEIGSTGNGKNPPLNPDRPMPSRGYALEHFPIYRNRPAPPPGHPMHDNSVGGRVGERAGAILR